jgi:hypothetical protein
MWRVLLIFSGREAALECSWAAVTAGCQLEGGCHQQHDTLSFADKTIYVEINSKQC